MSKIMIYAPLSAIGGTIENVWGTEMRVKSIDASDKDAVEQAKADGWSNKAQDVIKQIEAQAMKKDNDKMKGQLSGGNDKRVKELEEQLSQALTEIAGFEQEREESVKVINEKIARIAELEDEKEVYQVFINSADADYEKLKVEQLQMLLDLRDKNYKTNDRKDTLIKLAKESE